MLKYCIVKLVDNVAKIIAFFICAHFFFQKPFSFTLRQVQLAKHTPSQIIQLAYCCALLEQRPVAIDGKPTTRFKKVAHFLEEAVKVVPLESIFQAIACSEKRVAERCLETMMQRTPRLYPSVMMLNAVESACERAQSIDIQALLLDMQHVTSSQQQTHTKLRPKSRISYSDAAKNVPHSSSAQTVVLPPVFLNQWQQIPTIFSLPAIQYLATSMRNLQQELWHQSQKVLDVVGKFNIDHVYPAQPDDKHNCILKSPIQTLKDARKKLTEYIKIAKDETELFQGTSAKLSNDQMLQVLKEIFHDDVAICVALLGAFMEHQIQIPLLNSPEDTVKALSSKAALGVWALFSLNRNDLQRLLESSEDNALTVEIKEYIEGVFSAHPETSNDRMYAGKLQFLLSSTEETVSCSSQYISYSLEHQLCENPKLKYLKTLQLNKLIKQWDKIFANDVLALVATSHRPLVARWLKWAILIHDLREVLAQYTCVGVTGLVNSGKSQLVKKLFKVEVSTSSFTLQCYVLQCICVRILHVQLLQSLIVPYNFIECASWHFCKQAYHSSIPVQSGG